MSRRLKMLVADLVPNFLGRANPPPANPGFSPNLGPAFDSHLVGFGLLLTGHGVGKSDGSKGCENLQDHDLIAPLE